MKKCKFYLIFLLFLTSVNAEEINIAASLAIPPYILDGGNSGMEVEIVKEALSNSAHSASISLYPLKRVYEAVNGGEVDAAMTVIPSDEHSNLFYSDSHIQYQNVAISLKKNAHDISSTSDLERFGIIAFQNATKYLGDEYSAVVKKAKSYSEKADQRVQIAMLFSGKIDVVVMDLNIYKSLLKSESRVDTSQEVVIHELFPKVDMTVAFSSSQYRDHFNKGLEALHSSGKYQQIMNKYVN